MKFLFVFFTSIFVLSSSHASDLGLLNPESVDQKVVNIIEKNQPHFECTIKDADERKVMQTPNLLSLEDNQGFYETWNEGNFRLKGFFREPADGKFLRSHVVLYRDTPANVNALTIFSGVIWLTEFHNKIKYQDGTNVKLYSMDTVFFTDPAQFNNKDRSSGSMQLECFAFLPKSAK